MQDMMRKERERNPEQFRQMQRLRSKARKQTITDEDDYDDDERSADEWDASMSDEEYGRKGAPAHVRCWPRMLCPIPSRVRGSNS